MINSRTNFFSLYLIITSTILLSCVLDLNESAAKSIIQEVHSSAQSGCFSIEVDSFDTPHVLFCDNSDLLYKKRNGSTWEKRVIGTCTTSSLAVDSKGYPHICYYHGVAKDLKYAYQTEHGWYDVTVTDTDDSGAYCDIVIDSKDTTHVSYLYYNPPLQWPDIKYSYYDPSGGGNWVHATASSSVYFSDGRTYLAIDENGLPHISYYDIDNEVRYVHQTFFGMTWHDENAGYGGDEYGHESPIAIDINGKVAIAYFDNGTGFGSKGRRRVYTFLDSQWKWNETDIATNMDTGWNGNTGFAVNSSGLPGICYEVDGKLIYQHKLGNEWIKKIIDTDVKTSGKMAFDSKGQPHFIYSKNDDKLYHALLRSFPWSSFFPAIFNQKQ